MLSPFLVVIYTHLFPKTNGRLHLCDSGLSFFQCMVFKECTHIMGNCQHSPRFLHYLSYAQMGQQWGEGDLFLNHGEMGAGQGEKRPGPGGEGAGADQVRSLPLKPANNNHPGWRHVP